jgi:hypothetical protein
MGVTERREATSHPLPISPPAAGCIRRCYPRLPPGPTGTMLCMIVPFQ